MKKVNIIFGLLLFLICNSKLQGQSNDSRYFTGKNRDGIREKISVENKYLQKAQRNIELLRKGNASLSFVDANGNPIKNLKIELKQISQDFLFGNLSEEVVDLPPDEAKKFEERFTALFNFTELTVKWQPYEPRQGRPEWQKLQKKLDWCKKNGITPKGHALGWTHRAGTPDWLLKLPVETANDLFKARIQNLVGGFKNQIRSWDVVNEPVNTIPWEMALKDTVSEEAKIDDGSRYDTKNISVHQTLPWVANSYRWAAEADKNGEFILNEFYLIAKPDIREKFYRLMKELQRKNIPVTGIGIQAHEPRDMWFSPIELIKTFDRMNELGLPLHITEFIPQSSGNPITGDWRKGIWSEEAQADYAEQFYTLAFGYPSMASIHWWGLSDKNIWLKGGGLVDEAYNPKPVYDRLIKLIKQDWMTKDLKLSTNRKGEASFRGFYGNYQLTVTQSNGNEKSFRVHLGKGTDTNFEFQLD
ncbi:endo-1,4-beta-xylanase [Pricia sp.]|uniref:endo-1,4-beta-xylanase n=1 Tax=Pricia sp. TaxID=2268138 RepID=UPI003592F99E